MCYSLVRIPPLCNLTLLELELVLIDSRRNPHPEQTVAHQMKRVLLTISLHQTQMNLHDSLVHKFANYKIMRNIILFPDSKHTLLVFYLNELHLLTFVGGNLSGDTMNFWVVYLLEWIIFCSQQNTLHVQQTR
jgi:hypothetical protein